MSENHDLLMEADNFARAYELTDPNGLTADLIRRMIAAVAKGEMMSTELFKDNQRIAAVLTPEHLTKTIKRVTEVWDEPLDVVHDIPPIVNAILASVVPSFAEESRRQVNLWPGTMQILRDAELSGDDYGPVTKVKMVPAPEDDDD